MNIILSKLPDNYIPIIPMEYQESTYESTKNLGQGKVISWPEETKKEPNAADK